MSDHTQEHLAAETTDAPISVAGFFETLRAYSSVILLILAVVATGYSVLALAIYLFSPAEHIMSQPFRLDFKGAAVGEYPNGTKFSAADIVATPVLIQVYRTNHLERFCSFPTFARAVFVLEANRALEALVNDYQARLADPKLTPLDRDRLQREFEQKRASIAKNDYSINLVRGTETSRIPRELASKILMDALSAWTNFVVKEQHVLTYQVSVLSPSVMDPAPNEVDDPVVGVVILRSKIERVLTNIRLVNELPASALARTSDGLSLAEIRLRLEDIVRFQLEPLVPRVRSVLPNPFATIQFMESQSAYDERRLAGQQELVQSIRDALLAYSRPEEMQAGIASSQRTPDTETVMPQISDTFLDRLMTLANNSADAAYRQRLIDEYKEAAASIAPLQQALDYDKYVLDQLRGASGGADSRQQDAIRHNIESARQQARVLTAKVGEIHKILSRNLNPSTQLYTTTSTPLSRTARGVSPKKLALIGLLLLLVSLPIIIGGCFLHNRIREENALAPGQQAGHT